jgi:hypothetical protein
MAVSAAVAAVHLLEDLRLLQLDLDALGETGHVYTAKAVCEAVALLADVLKTVTTTLNERTYHTMKTTTPKPHDPAAAARAKLDAKRDMAREPTPYTLGRQSLNGLNGVTPNDPVPSVSETAPVLPNLRTMIQQELTALEGDITAMQAQYEAIMRTITQRREQCQHLRAYLACTEQEPGL